MGNAIVGLSFSPAKGTKGFRVVSNDSNASPLHFGFFLADADARVLATELNAEAGSARSKVVPFTAR